MRRSRAPSRAALSPSSVCGDGSPATGGNACRSAGKENLSGSGAVGEAYESQDMKRVNTAALRKGSVNVVRAPILGCLTVPRGVVSGAFKLPGGAKRTNEGKDLLRRKSLGVRRPITFMTSSKFRPPSPPDKPANGDFELQETADEDEGAGIPVPQEDTFEPLVLWEAGAGEEDHRIGVDPRLCKYLRPHQREGVQFMFECVMGMREFEGNGCILADDMGLGKTLQSITVLWTLLKQGMTKGQPTVRRAIVVCPTSLVKNWEAEIEKWLKGDCRVIALSETTRDQVVQSINLFLASMVYRVLVVSYETFRLHSERFYAKADTCCDLLICDEAHRLKNADTATNQALSKLKCRKRVLLSGTPMQNDLEEFYAMTDFTNPGVLGSGSSFRKKFLAPILAGREPSATEQQVERAQKCQNEMSTVVNEFILRRTNNINAKHLPPKLVQVVCCRLTPVQTNIYKHLLSSKEIRHILNGKQTNILSSIGAMQKLCNHPKLLVEGASGTDRGSGAAEIASFLPTTTPVNSSGGGGFGFGRRGGGGAQKGVFPEWSGKMETLYRLMKEMRNTGDDRIVVVSNYTQSLDLIGAMCRENSWPFVRLDGSTGVSKRQKMVDAFNQPGPQSFAFLLSSKAGGCGLNLIGGNRLVLFDPDWNPAVDKQAAARVWRDGQKKRCFVYRFVSTGTIEEKVFQRQLSKEGLQNIVDDKEEVNSLSSKDLKDLFKLIEGTPSDTHDKLRCKRCRIEEAVQAMKDVDSQAFKRALPKQLAVCEELLTELQLLPEADVFREQWDPNEHHVTAEAFANAVHEPMDFTKIANRLRASSLSSPIAAAEAPRCDQDKLTEDQGEDHLGGDAQGGAITSGGMNGPSQSLSPGQSTIATYASVPAFARDMNLVFSNVRRLWPPGSVGGDNRLTKAADSLKMAFDERWRGLAPLLHSIQREELETARQDAKARAQEGRDENLPPPPQFQEQMGMPKEEDLNSWSHHYSTDTADDPVFRGAMMGTGDSLVSFIFGLEVTWGLMETQLQEEAEARALDIKVKSEARAARAAERKKAAAATAAAASPSSDEQSAQGEPEPAREDDASPTDSPDGQKRGRKRRRSLQATCGEDAADAGSAGPKAAASDDDIAATKEGPSEADQGWMHQNEGRGGGHDAPAVEAGSKRKVIREESDEEGDHDVCSVEGTQLDAPRDMAAEAHLSSSSESAASDEELMETPPLASSLEGLSAEGHNDNSWTVPATNPSPTRYHASKMHENGDDLAANSKGPCQSVVGETVVGNGGPHPHGSPALEAGIENAVDGTPAGQRRSWVCSKCTFENSLSDRKCSVCGGGVRPAGMGRSKPLSPRPVGEENRGPDSASQEGARGQEAKAPKQKQAAKEKKRKRDIWMDDDDDFE